jgi:hypothetical protein
MLLNYGFKTGSEFAVIYLPGKITFVLVARGGHKV